MILMDENKVNFCIGLGEGIGKGHITTEEANLILSGRKIADREFADPEVRAEYEKFIDKCEEQK